MTLGAALVAPEDAHAGYIWMGPASLCQPSKADYNRINYVGSSLFNESTLNTAKVFCALPYEYYTFTSTTSSPTFEVGYVDPTPTRVSCTLLVSDPSGAPVYSSTTTSFSKNTLTQYMDWTTSSTMFNGYNNVSISCSLPKATSSTVESGVTEVRVFR